MKNNNTGTDLRVLENKKRELNSLIESHYRERINTYLKSPRDVDNFKNSLFEMSDLLVKHDVKDVLNSALALANLGLSINKMRGLAYVVPYNGRLRPVISYRGYVSLAERSGKRIKWDYIYKCDKYTFRKDGFNDIFQIEPNLDERDEANEKWFDENLIGIAVKILDSKDGGVSVDIVSKSTLKKLRDASPSDGAYKWLREMYLAKALKYVLSRVIYDDDFLRGVNMDDEDLQDYYESQNTGAPAGTTQAPAQPKDNLYDFIDAGDVGAQEPAPAPEQELAPEYRKTNPKPKQEAPKKEAPKVSQEQGVIDIDDLGSDVGAPVRGGEQEFDYDPKTGEMLF